MGKKTLIFILLVGFFLRLINLNQSFWLDEAAQVLESLRPLNQQLKITSDFHPPLFHLLLHFWLYFGKSEVWVRLLSVFFGLGSLLVLYELAKSLGNKKEGLLALLFLAISPYHLWYSQEARPYVLFVFLSLLSTLFLVKKKWGAYTIMTILSLYSLYFAPFMIIGQLFFAFFFERKSFKKMIICLLFSILIFLPWLPEFSRQLVRGTGGGFPGWTEVVSVHPFKALPLTFAKFIFGKGSIDNNLIYALIILPVFLLFVASLGRIYKSREGKIAIILFFVPFLLVSLFSLLIPIMAPQRLLFLLPLFYLIIAKGISKLSIGRQKGALLIVLLTSLGGIYQYYTNPYVQREQWRQATSFVEETADDKSIVLFVFPTPFASYSWYQKGKVEAIGIALKFNLTQEDLINLLPKIKARSKIYLFQYLTGLTDPKGETRSFIEANGYRESKIKDFPGVGFIYIYDKI